MWEVVKRHAGEAAWNIGILAGIGSLVTVIGLAAVGLSPSTLAHWIVSTTLDLLSF